MDSLRYWVTEMHVDGFRFDLASTLARQFHEVDRLSAFFDLVQQDPVVSQVKLIAEPWDVGDGGYQVGNFPPLWTEWNGKYRDTVRDFWRGEPGTLGEFASRLTGSQRPLRARRPQADRVDQLRHRARRLHAARPGLLQREAQRGQRRGQQRRREPQPVVELRRRGRDRRPGGPRAAGAPAAQLPDDAAAVARACRCCRTATSSAAPSAATTTSTARTTSSPGSTGTSTVAEATCWRSPGAWSRCAREHPVFRRRRFFAGRPTSGGETELGDIAWFTPTGEQMTEADWRRRVRKSRDGVPQRRGHPRARPARRRVVDDSFLLLFNADHEEAAFVAARRGVRRALGRRGHRSRRRRPDAAGAGSELTAAPRSVIVLRSPREARLAVRSRDLPAGCEHAPAHRPEPGRAVPTGDLPAAAAAGFGVRRGRRGRPTSPRSGSRTSTCRRCCRRPPARRTATTSSTTPASARTSAAEARSSALVAALRASTGSASSSTSCPTTWRCRSRRTSTRRCGRCCATGAGRRTPGGSTSTGPPRTAGCCMPVLGGRSGRSSPPASCARRGRRPDGPSRSCATTTTSSRSGRHRGPAAGRAGRPAVVPAGVAGAWRTRSSTTAGSSTSTRSPRSGSRTRGLRRHARPAARAARGRRGRRLPDRPPRRPGRPAAATSRRLADATGGRWVVVEKILEGDETLPADWPCAGTTGYDALLRRAGR